jgi:hypothetical protein
MSPGAHYPHSRHQRVRLKSRFGRLFGDEKAHARKSSRITLMPQALRIATVADEAPQSDAVTGYDRDHASVYAGLLEAEADGADWMEASVTVLRIDPIREPARARRAWESHLSRAKWMSEHHTVFAHSTDFDASHTTAVQRS